MFVKWIIKDVFSLRSSFITDCNVLTVVQQKVDTSSDVVNLFHCLCDLIEMFNSCLSLSIVFVIVYLFLMSLFASYNHVWTFVNEREKFFFVVASDGTWIMFNFIFHSCFIHSCSRATHEANQTAIIVSKIINQNKCNRNHQEIFKSFLTQVQYRNLELQTIFFKINWKLLLTVN